MDIFIRKRQGKGWVKVNWVQIVYHKPLFRVWLITYLNLYWKDAFFTCWALVLECEHQSLAIDYIAQLLLCRFPLDLKFSKISGNELKKIFWVQNPVKTNCSSQKSLKFIKTNCSSFSSLKLFKTFWLESNNIPNF